MIIKISGEKYNFGIVSENQEFYIEAEDKLTHRFSFINNLNPILSEFNIKINDRRVSESQWIVLKNQSRTFMNIAKEFLSDKYFRDYLEEKLDEDRICSEWENMKKNCR